MENTRPYDKAIIIVNKNMIYDLPINKSKELLEKINTSVCPVVEIDRYKYIWSLKGGLNSKVSNSLYPNNIKRCLRDHDSDKLCIIADMDTIDAADDELYHCISRWFYELGFFGMTDTIMNIGYMENLARINKYEVKKDNTKCTRLSSMVQGLSDILDSLSEN